MGRIVIVRDFARAIHEQGSNVSDVIVDGGGGENITAEHYADAGDDSYPLKTDYAITVNTKRKGGESIVGYADVINIPKAQSGDKRIYARDSNGDAIVDVWLKADGSANIANDNGSITLQPDGSISVINSSGSITLQAGGDVNINGVVIDTAGNITSPSTITGDTVVASSSLTADGKEMVDHIHTGGIIMPGNVTGPNQ